MASIAHEGNPRITDALVVSGTLDGTATLLIQFPPQLADRPLPPSPPVENSKESISCHQVFSWTRPADPVQWVTTLETYSPTLHYKAKDRIADVTIHQSTACYGILTSLIPGIAAPESISFACSFKELVSGTPVSGICFLATHANGALPNNVTCLALVVNWATGVTGLYRFVNADLGSLNNATLLYSAAYTPAVGDYFFLASVQDSFENTITASIYAEGDYGGTLLWGTSLTLVVSNNARAGLIAIGGPEGTARFGASTSDTPTSSITLFGDNDEDTSS